MNRLVFTAAMLIILIISFNAYAQEEKTSTTFEENDSQGFGFHFGNVSGTGYAYRYWMDKWGIQGVIGGLTSGTNKYSFPGIIQENYALDPPLILTDNDEGRKYSFNFGANVMYSLKRTSNTNFYVHGGFSWSYVDKKFYRQTYSLVSSKELYSYTVTGKPTSHHDIKRNLNVGAGPGVEIDVGKFFKVAIELPLTFTGDREFIMYIPQVGLYYYFR